jgi:hypothetical protein
MQDLLVKGGLQGAAVISAVTTWSGGRSKELEELAEALREYEKEESRDKVPDKYAEDEDGTNSEEEEAAAPSGEELAPTSLTEADESPRDIVALTTDEEKARALEECYYNLIARHFGARKTQEKLERHYS